eukprot:1140840-Pelagomonas_calceolata.AAC.5
MGKFAGAGGIGTLLDAEGNGLMLDAERIRILLDAEGMRLLLEGVDPEGCRGDMGKLAGAGGTAERLLQLGKQSSIAEDGALSQGTRPNLAQASNCFLSATPETFQVQLIRGTCTPCILEGLGPYHVSFNAMRCVAPWRDWTMQESCHVLIGAMCAALLFGHRSKP